MAITISGSGITSANIADGTIVNADVNDVAASKLTGALPAISGASLTNLPGGGKVLQVVSNTYSTGGSTSSTTYVDTGFTGSITPTSATSKILVLCNMPTPGKYNGNGDGYYKLVRDSLDVVSPMLVVFDNQSSPVYHLAGTGSTSYLDSPATVDTLVYKVMSKCSGCTCHWMNGAATATMTLLEIEG